MPHKSAISTIKARPDCHALSKANMMNKRMWLSYLPDIPLLALYPELYTLSVPYQISIDQTTGRD